jgi:transcriptional regulator with XRE-family HTH domain
MEALNIGTTIRGVRLQKGMSQGDIEKRTGLLRCYLSRVENGHTVPSLDTKLPAPWTCLWPISSPRMP